ncbi:hypothetical protein FACS1894190_09730 [Spirochaetia bacterium]|nr:hypothetical protein FACS1894190_09730 [Spirochaetia bacterium]
MKRVCFVLFISIFFLHWSYSQDTGNTSNDIDDLFSSEYELTVETPDDFKDAEDNILTNKKKPVYNLLQDLINRSGFGIDTSYAVTGSYMPGLSEAPWFKKKDGSDPEWTNPLGATMEATIGLDIQPTKVLRVRQSVTFAIPSPTIKIKEIYFDYNFRDRVFIKAGKYDIAWGLSPNFPFANLLARVPDDVSNPGDTLVAKIDVPIGVGGAQVVLFTRNGFMKNVNLPQLEEFGVGFKYNIAVPNFDIDIGAFYFKKMPLRGFISLKTTLFKNTEFYTETMLSVKHDTWKDFSFSCSVGFSQDFFKDIVHLNAEFYYNGEGNSNTMRKNSIIRDEEQTFKIFHGINAALNISVRPGLPLKLRFFLSYLHSFNLISGQLVPGFSIEPAEHLMLYFAVPMATGVQDVGYYRQNTDVTNRPFGLIFAVKINANFRYGHFN